MNDHFNSRIVYAVLGAVFGLPALLQGAILRVDPNRPEAFATLQQAIDASGNGDTILAADGVYRGPGNRDLSFATKAITLRSEHGPERCVIDCEDQSSAFTLTAGCLGLTLDGFTITHGSADQGGAIDASDVGRLTVINCIFRENNAVKDEGGAIYAYRCHTAFYHCSFLSNSASDHGGAVALSGGFGYSVLLEDCRFVDNSAHLSGGALYNERGVLNLRRCGFYGNQAGWRGGAVYNTWNSLVMANCVISGNSAGFGGGGAYLRGQGVTLLHCTLYANTSVGSGGGLNFDDKRQDRARVYGTILWGNRGSGSEHTTTAQVSGADPDMIYCCVQNWPASDTIISQDPLFADANGLDGQAGTADDDLSLQAGSPCTDAGFLDATPWPFDLDYSRRERLAGSVVDIGAFESGAGDQTEPVETESEPTPIVISEVLTHSPGTRDWVELHNTTDRAVNISGWQLQDRSLNTYVVPPDTWIGAQGYWVIYQGDDFSFGFEARGDEISLVSTVNGIATGSFQYHYLPAVPALTTLIRHVSSVGLVEMVPSTEATLGFANAAPAIGPLVVTEIMYRPAQEPQSGQYIEVCNIGSSTVPANWLVRGASSWNSDVALSPGEYLVVAKDPEALVQMYPNLPADAKVVGPYDGLLGETVADVMLLTYDQADARHVVVDSVVYNSAYPLDSELWPVLWPEAANGQGDALHRIELDGYANDPANWEAAPPTPGY